jgi:hypothetical protein
MRTGRPRKYDLRALGLEFARTTTLDGLTWKAACEKLGISSGTAGRALRAWGWRETLLNLTSKPWV